MLSESNSKPNNGIIFFFPEVKSLGELDLENLLESRHILRFKKRLQITYQQGLYVFVGIEHAFFWI